MADSKKSISNLDIENRKKELSNINVLYNTFGETAYAAIEKQYIGSGYEAGVERLTKLVKDAKFSRSKFADNPVKGVEEFLHGFFVDRGGNMPQVWSDDNTVYLKTENHVSCVTINAEKQVKVAHKEICNLFCRAWATGFLKIFEDFFPGISINFRNVSSKRCGKDCVEAFEVVTP